MLDKAWVHLRRADPAYERGAWSFVNAVLGDSDLVICPCIDCQNLDRHQPSTVVHHLVTKGMDETYKTRNDWFYHGEVDSEAQDGRKTSQWNDEIFRLFQAAEYSDEELFEKDDLYEVPEGEDKQEDEFLSKIADAETPLYPNCSSHSKLSAIVTLYRLKTENGWSDKSFDKLLETLSEMLPVDNVLHTSFYDVKKFLRSLGLGYEKIHACVNDCILFRKKYEMAESCPKCKASRWKINMQTGEVQKGVPQKVLRYFPIIPRLKRMFKSEEMAKNLRWHFTNKSSDGKIRHPVDSVAWDQINDMYPSFASEERNIRLGLSTDGFNPFNMRNSKYSCWPVLLVNYNMPPHLCMKKEHIFLTLLIPGPHQPGNNIDVYLEPLIEDLNHLWSTGEVTYDVYSKTTFTLKAILLWTINDFPAYGNLAGCKVKGKMACPICGKSTDSHWLKHSRKHVYMCHRKRLPPTHRYRSKKSWFDGKAEYGTKGRIQTGHDISQLLKNFKNDFGNAKESGKKRKGWSRLQQAAADQEQDPVQPPSKKRRGPTRMKHIYRDSNVRETVDFTEFGEPCGPGSVKLSSYLGVLVREHVPILIDDWRKVSENIKIVLWKSIQARFELDEEFQKTAVFRQMGCNWRSFKSRVVTKIRKARTMKDRMELKPKNIPPMEWRKFVNQKTSLAFKAVSDSYKERRQKQIPHTVSRKGMVRLTEEMKKSCPEPSQLTRLEVWVKSRTKKDGTPVNNQAAEKIRKAEDVETGATSSSTTTFGKNDTLSQILGPDNPGRLRAMGRGMSTTKLACYQVKSAYMNQMQENQAQLQQKVQELEAIVQKMNNQREDEQGEASTPRSVNKAVPAKCLLIDWTGTEETVAEGRLLSADPEECVNEIPLGPDSVKVLVESAIIPNASLWRPTTEIGSIEEAVGHIIAWNADSCVDADKEVSEDDSVPKSPYLSSKNRCTLMGLGKNYDKPVAEGRCQSRDPQAMVNGIPIGQNAVKVYVDVVLLPLAFPWRPTQDVKKMEQTLHSFVAWPANRVENETEIEVSVQKYSQGRKSPANSTSKSKSTPSLEESLETRKTSAAGPMATSQTSQSTPKAPAKKTKQSAMQNVVKDNKKCKLMDITGSNQVVAEGRWASNDPCVSVHCVPLGPDAVRVWVDVVKIKSAAVWRTSSEIETMADAQGTSIAWPEDKVVMCSQD